MQWEAVLPRFVELAPSTGGTDKPVDAAVIRKLSKLHARNKKYDTRWGTQCDGEDNLKGGENITILFINVPL